MSDTRNRLIESAFDLFGRNGFHAIGLDAILAEVGVSKQTFYNHFESKDALFLAVLERRHEEESALFKRLFQQLGGDDPRDRLYALFDVMEAWFNQPNWKGCIFMNATAEFPLPTEPAHRAAADHLLATREQLLYFAALAGASNPTLLADQLIILVEGVLGARHTTGDERYLAVTRDIATALLDRQFADASRPSTPLRMARVS